MNTPHKNTPVLAADIPAVPAAGCIFMAGGIITWICVTGIILLFITVLNFGKMMSGVNRSLLFPSFSPLLDKNHTVEQRGAFSNAFMQYSDVMYTDGVTGSNVWTLGVMNTIILAAQDKVITRSESSNLVATVAAHVPIEPGRYGK